MAKDNDQEVKIKQYGECHLVDNSERKFGSSNVYFAVALKFHDQAQGIGKDLPDDVCLFTHLELCQALDRSKGNREDIPSVTRPWLLRILGLA